MPAEVVYQVYHHARRAKANKKKIRFTDVMNRDLDVLYAELEDNDDEEHPIPQVDGITGLYDRELEFGDYVQTHEEQDNSMGTRTVGAIATRPTVNVQGG